MKNTICMLASVGAMAVTSAAHAQKQKVVIPAATMPWTDNATLNHNKQYGTNDGTAPVIVTLASLGAAPGQKLLITYVSGTICPGGPYACADAKGDANFVTDHNTGNSGKYFPSRYVAKEPTYLEEMIGVFTDAKGKIVGRPFAVPDRGTPTIPAGATQLQLGANDDIYSDNTGSWSIAVSVR